MKPNTLLVLASISMALAGCGKPQASAPVWVSEKSDLLKRLGIDPSADLVEVANYHWSWTARREVAAGGFHCPTGSSVDVSRSIVLIRAPSPQACRGPGGSAAQILKVFPDGSSEPLGGEGG